jgi:hypothetical protein
VVATSATLVGLLTSGALTLKPPGTGSGGPDSATAVSRVQIDAPHPLVAEKRVKGAETITPRSRIFAFLMAETRIINGISRRAGLEPGELAVANAGSDAPLEITPLADEAASATVPSGDNVVTVSADPQVPVISLTAAAPDAASARMLADAATAELVSLVERIAPGADARRRLLAKPLGAPAVEVEPGGLRWHVGLAAAMMVFVLWCSAIALASGAMRAWRAMDGPTRAASGEPQQS